MVINHKTIAAHFGKTNEAMRKLSKKGSPLYTVYVKAYLYDTAGGSTQPLAVVCDRERFESIAPRQVYTKGDFSARIDTIQHRVGLKVGDRYWIQQFGRLDQAEEAYIRIIKENI